MAKDPKSRDAQQHPDTIERTAVVTVALLEQLHEVLTDPASPDDVSLGILMGLTIFLDEKIGPFRSQRLLMSAHGIVLRTDAHVGTEQVQRAIPVLRAFGSHLAGLGADDLLPAVQPPEVRRA